MYRKNNFNYFILQTKKQKFSIKENITSFFFIKQTSLGINTKIQNVIQTLKLKNLSE